VLAVLAPIFGIFIAKPIESELSVGFDKLLLTYDKDSLETLQNQKKEAETIRDFIEHKQGFSQKVKRTHVDWNTTACEKVPTNSIHFTTNKVVH